LARVSDARQLAGSTLCSSFFREGLVVPRGAEGVFELTHMGYEIADHIRAHREQEPVGKF
jgi:hypothetical protein